MSQPTPLHDAAARAGAVFTEEAGWAVPAHFGDSVREYEQALTGCVLFDQSHRGKLALTGTEAARFLHNLTTQDVVNLPAGEGREGFAVTAKARVVAYFYLFHEKSSRGESVYHLDLPPGTAEKTLQHLDRFRISEQVEFEDRTRFYAQFQIAGPNAEVAIETAFGSNRSWILDMKDRGLLRRRDLLNLPGYDVFCELTTMPEDLWNRFRGDAPGLPEYDPRNPTSLWPETFWKQLTDAGVTPAGRDAYELLRIEAGTPAFGPEIDENTFVPEVGRARQAICYTKGCYLGQEPIVMARDRGQVNRTLLGLKLTDDPAPHGSLVFRDDKEIGRVTSSVQSPRLGAIALAYIRRGNQEPGTAVVVEVKGMRRPAVVSALPFTG